MNHDFEKERQQRLKSPATLRLFGWLALLLGVTAASAQPVQRWWKGNLHTHTLWSDGDDYPEMVVDWYKTRGYDFLALSDHNILQEGTAWIYATNGTAAQHALPKYVRRFGSNWVEQAEHAGHPVVRLKTLAEFREQFEAPGRFLLIQAEEVTDRFGRWPVHLIASNIREFLPPRGGGSVLEVLQNNVDALLEQRRQTGQPMIIHVAHPNFGWAVTAEDLIQLRGEKFFELYNGHPHVHNDGDAIHASTERMWDIVNTHRVAERREVLYGVAVDDAHHYAKMSAANANPGRGWVVVRAPELKANTIINALEVGEFFSSSGVHLNDISWRDNKLTVRIDAQPGVTYTTQFIGTRRPVNWESQPVVNKKGDALAVTRLYSGGIGTVLAEQQGTVASYTCKGDELYVRAKIVSSKLQQNPVVAGEREMAWTQPVLPERK
jgi:hypothetical protein